MAASSVATCSCRYRHSDRVVRLQVNLLWYYNRAMRQHSVANPGGLVYLAGKETPDNLRIKINLSIGSTALVLLGSDNTTELLKAGLDGLKSVVHMYPETLEVLAAVQVTSSC